VLKDQVDSKELLLE